MWLICSIILISISLYVYFNTYDAWDIRNMDPKDITSDSRFKMPAWVIILGVIGLLIPILRWILFATGIFFYIMFYAEDEIVFNPKCKIVSGIINFFKSEL